MADFCLNGRFLVLNGKFDQLKKRIKYDMIK